MSEPTAPFDCVAVAPYTARNEAEVSLVVGQTYHVLQTDGKGLWWQTMQDGRIGWFPASYTQPQVAAPPVPEPVHVAPAPTPQPAAQQYQQPAAQPQQTNHSQPQPTTTSSSSSGSGSGQPAAGEKPSQPTVDHPEKNRTQVYVKLQICEARNLKGVASKCTPTAFVYRRKALDDGKGEPVFKTATAKKTNSPKWNELFTLNVYDQEFEIICVKLSNAKKFTPKGKDYLGEVEISLRGAVCDFVSPSYKYKWFPIISKGGTSDCTGDILLYLELVDTREGHGPTNFKHESHIGFSAGEWNVQNIPAAWKNFFKSQGIKKGDLVNNPEFANEVFSHMQNAAQNGQLDNILAGGAESGAAAPAPPMATNTAAPPPPPAPMASGPPPPPAPGMAKKPAPPVPSAPRPPVQQEQQYEEPEQQAGQDGQDEPEAPKSSGGSFLDQIAKSGGKFALKKVEATEKAPEPAGGGTLADALKGTMAKYRKDIDGNDEDDDNDDWD